MTSTIPHFIGGQIDESASLGHQDVYNPATGQVSGRKVNFEGQAGKFQNMRVGRRPHTPSMVPSPVAGMGPAGARRHAKHRISTLPPADILG